MYRIILATVLQLLAAVTIIISFQPSVALLIGKDLDREPQSYYERMYSDYFVIRALLIALAGIGTGSGFLWMSGKMKPMVAPQPKGTGVLLFVSKRLGVLAALVAGIIITFFCLNCRFFSGRTLISECLWNRPRSPPTAWFLWG